MKAFISYCHKDKEFLDGLHEHLASLRRQEAIIVWTDREIPAGGIIDDHVDEQMDDAELYLLLVSSAFIDSRYCFEKEFARALERQSAGHAIIVPIIIRDCDWNIPTLRKFKALPEDGKPVNSRHWHSQDEAFANVASGLRELLADAPFSKSQSKARKVRESPKKKFIPDETHVTMEQKEKLNDICKEVVERMTVKTASESEEEAKRKTGMWFGIIWSQFNANFEIGQLSELPRDRFEEAKSWLLQYRASKDKNLKRANPEKYRNTLTKTIFTLSGKLGWSDDAVHAFAGEVLERAVAVSTLKDLPTRQLELIRDRVRYEHTKRGIKNGQAKARKKPRFAQPKLPGAKQLLEEMLAHPVAEQRGFSEILRDSPSGPLDVCYIPNITARGNVAIIRKSILRPALSELVQLGWLLLPEGNANVRIYELNPQTQL